MPKRKSSRKMKSSHPNRQLPPQATASLARNQPVQRCSACHFPCMLSQSRERVKQEVVQGRVNLRALSCQRYTKCTHIASSIILKSASTLDWYGNALKLLRLLSELLPFLPHQSLLIHVISSLQRETSQGWNSIRFSDAGPTNAIKVPCRGSFLSI